MGHDAAFGKLLCGMIPLDTISVDDKVEADGECVQEHGNSSSYVNAFISPGGRDPYCIGFVGP